MKNFALLLAATLCLAMAAPAVAGGACGVGSPNSCAGCGCHSKCRQVTCQVVCDVKKVEKLCWDVKCEEYCLPRPVLGSALCKSCASKCGGQCSTGCGTGCDSGCGASCGNGCGKCKLGQLQPDVTCGHLRTKKKLMLRKITVEIPVYKCEVKYLCSGCEANAEVIAPQESAPAPEAAPLPPAPKQAAIPVLPRF